MSLITLDDRTREESVARDQAYFQPYITGNVRQPSRQALGRAMGCTVFGNEDAHCCRRMTCPRTA
jgi:hypothetical protein